MISGIIVAAGKGVRMNRTVRKQYLNLEGQPILCHTLEAIGGCNIIDEIVLVVPEEDFDYCRRHILPVSGLEKKTTLVAGGPERQDSVYSGLLAVEESDDIVVIHDGVRPFIQQQSLVDCVENAKRFGACILGIPASDTIKNVSSSGFIDGTLDRETMWLAQTPQAFRYRIIKEAHDAARRDGYRATDDALLVERLGHKVKIVRGDRYNLKITTAEDLVIASAILQTRSKKSLLA